MPHTCPSNLLGTAPSAHCTTPPLPLSKGPHLCQKYKAATSRLGFSVPSFPCLLFFQYFKFLKNLFKSHFQNHKTYKYENTWMINFPLISSVKLHSRPTHLTEHSLITFRCCFSILTETLNPNTHHAIVLHLPQHHHVMETWSVLLPLKPLALGCCVYSRSVC